MKMQKVVKNIFILQTYSIDLSSIYTNYWQKHANLPCTHTLNKTMRKPYTLNNTKVKCLYGAFLHLLIDHNITINWII